MVVICPEKFTEPAIPGFDLFSHELYPFQKWAIYALTHGHHVLVCAPTGSGKTLPGEFAVQHFTRQNKKVIYTSPIKALSNEKFHSFTSKYPDISVGLITGDIKTNPGADVLIMTTEILMNKLLSPDIQSTSVTHFDMNIREELGCVIFDEIHMINDTHRGYVWEQCILLLPRNISMVGLSATLDNPQQFAKWMETRGDSHAEKQVYLSCKTTRAVPLTHYLYLVSPAAVFKKIKDKTTQENIKKLSFTPLPVLSPTTSFNDALFHQIQSTKKMFYHHSINVTRAHVINSLCSHLAEKEMFPAICFVFSKKQLEQCAIDMTTNILEFDSKIPYTAEAECTKILRRLPNWEEYAGLPEYQFLVKMLSKGVGIHHAGLVPIFREIVEIMFTQGYVKLLFCTETMSVGINLPVKTTIFTNICKYNGDQGHRLLHPYEYTQAAGRAGRLGLDAAGHVIHLSNLISVTDVNQYRQMMSGAPPKITSMFSATYPLLLTSTPDELLKLFRGSFETQFRAQQQATLFAKISDVEERIEKQRRDIASVSVPEEIGRSYSALRDTTRFPNGKKKKEAERKLAQWREEYPQIVDRMLFVDQLCASEKELHELREDMNRLTDDRYMRAFLAIKNRLADFGCMDPHTHELTRMGRVASLLHELHPIAFAEKYVQGVWQTMSADNLAASLSCFMDISFSEQREDREEDVVELPAYVKKVVYSLRDRIEFYGDWECVQEIAIKTPEGFQEKTYGLVRDWMRSETEDECQEVIYRAQNYGLFLGEWIKLLLKIQTVVNELIKVAEVDCNVPMSHLLEEIAPQLLKFVVTPQSLYL